jgi:hypothetical protein
MACFKLQFCINKFEFTWKNNWVRFILMMSGSRGSLCISWPLKLGPIIFPEKYVRNYHSMLFSIPEGLKVQVYLIVEEIIELT